MDTFIVSHFWIFLYHIGPKSHDKSLKDFEFKLMRNLPLLQSLNASWFLIESINYVNDVISPLEFSSQILP